MDLSLPWSPQIHWDGPAGKVIIELAEAINASEFAASPVFVTVFGSAPLQLCLEPNFVSVDVAIFSSTDLRQLIQRAQLAKGQSSVYVEQTDEIVFSASTSWRERAFSVQRGAVTFSFPHPLDI